MHEAAKYNTKNATTKSNAKHKKSHRCSIVLRELLPIGLSGNESDGKTQEDDNNYDKSIGIVGASYSYVASKSH